MLQALVRVLALSQGVQYIKLQFRWSYLLQRCYAVAKYIVDFCDGDDSEALSITLVFASRYGHHINAISDEQIAIFVMKCAKAVEAMRTELDEIEVEPVEEKVVEPIQEDNKQEGDQGGNEVKPWDETLVSTFEISPPAKRALADAGLVTIKDVLAYEATGKTLVDIRGISATAAKIILDQIAALKPAEGS